MNKQHRKNINESLVQKVLIDPIKDGANKLIIISGYASHNMASWHLKEINEQSLSPIEISLIIGMCSKDGLNQDIHNGIKELVDLNDPVYSRFNCNYVFQGNPTHSKVYIWFKDNKPIKAFTGSANYTQKGFSSKQREYMVECDANEAYQYYLTLEEDTIFCNHSEVEEYIKFSASRSGVTTGVKQEKITLSLLTRTGKIGHGSGINWGIRPNGTKRNRNQAYIPVPAEIVRSEFFPLEKTHFSVMTDDGKHLICRLEQAGNKALTTPLNNALLGEYIRNRLGVANGAFVTKEMLEKYGRTHITFTKIDDELFYMDFSV